MLYECSLTDLVCGETVNAFNSILLIFGFLGITIFKFLKILSSRSNLKSVCKNLKVLILEKPQQTNKANTRKTLTKHSQNTRTTLTEPLAVAVAAVRKYGIFHCSEPRRHHYGEGTRWEQTRVPVHL